VEVASVAAVPIARAFRASCWTMPRRPQDRRLPTYIAHDVGLNETPSARVVMFFSAHHRGYYSELEDAIGRMSEQVWEYFNYREKESEFTLEHSF
jgi:hypothetical protein